MRAKQRALQQVRQHFLYHAGRGSGAAQSLMAEMCDASVASAAARRRESCAGDLTCLRLYSQRQMERWSDATLRPELCGYSEFRHACTQNPSALARYVWLSHHG